MFKIPTGIVAFLSSDIEGSTQLLRRLGDRYPGVLAQHQAILRAAFEKYGGYEVGAEGDAFFVAFSRASDALGAAVAGQRELFAHPWPADNRVFVLMGTH